MRFLKYVLIFTPLALSSLAGPVDCTKELTGPVSRGPAHELIFIQGFTAAGPSLVEFDTNEMINLNFKERIFDSAKIQLDQGRISDAYFSLLQDQRGFTRERIDGYKASERLLSIEKKAWLGIFEKKNQKMIGSLRMVRVTPSEENLLPVAQGLRKRGINFQASDLIAHDKAFANLKYIHEAGRAFRSADEPGEDAKKIWEVFFGTHSLGHPNDLIIANTDAAGALLYERDFGLKVKKRISRDDQGIWHMRDASEVTRKANPAEEAEYIMAASTLTIQQRILERIMTQKSYWSFFNRYPSVQSYFENVFTGGAGVEYLKGNPRYLEYFKATHD